MPEPGKTTTKDAGSPQSDENKTLTLMCILGENRIGKCIGIGRGWGLFDLRTAEMDNHPCGRALVLETLERRDSSCQVFRAMPT